MSEDDVWHGQAIFTGKNGDIKETLFNRRVMEMYEKRSNALEGWSFQKIGVFSGDSGQEFVDGTFKGSDKWRSHIHILV